MGRDTLASGRKTMRTAVLGARDQGPREAQTDAGKETGQEQGRRDEERMDTGRMGGWESGVFAKST